jgi:hypothetical protein
LPHPVFCIGHRRARVMVWCMPPGERRTTPLARAYAPPMAFFEDPLARACLADGRWEQAEITRASAPQHSKLSR